MAKKYTLFLFFFCCCSGLLQAQQQPLCGTDEAHHKLLQRFPSLGEADARFQQELIREMYHSGILRTARVTDGPADTTIYDIPVVVHIIHDYGAEFIPDDSVYNAVRKWNITYMKLNADTVNVIAPFKPYIGNPRIRFHLATKDPNGVPTKGITRRKSYNTVNGNDYGKLDGWPRDRYLNIWVVKTIEGGAAGYARYPVVGDVMPYYDGVMVLYNYLGYANTTSHEIGHYLSLWHTFGNNAITGVTCGDDGVDDTPPTKGHSPVGCVNSALYDTSCATNYFMVYQDSHGLDSIVDYPDTVNAQNIMDYTYCDIMFTKQQVQRMRMILTGTLAQRNNLYTPANLALTGALDNNDLPPVAEFSVENGITSNIPTYEKMYFGLVNGKTKFNFRNRSWNDTVTAVSWTFSNGAEVATSANMTTNISNSFSQPGWVSISITATGNNTGTVTYTNPKAVYVADTVPMNPAGFVQHFSSADETAKWPMFNYYNNQFQWELYNGAGIGDNSCVRYHSYDDRVSPQNKTGLAAGDYDDIFTPAFDLQEFASGGSPLYLNFYTSGAYRYRQDSIYNWPVFEDQVDSIASDSLQIMATNNMGHSWAVIGTIKKDDLQNKGRINTEYMPSGAGDWVARAINIPAAYRTPTTFFKLRYRPGRNSNNLYLDRLSVTPYPTEVPELLTQPDNIVIYPNPTGKDCNIAFNTGADGHTEYKVTDMTGKLLWHVTRQMASYSAVHEIIPAHVFPAPGIYFITVVNAHKISTQKLLVR